MMTRRSFDTRRHVRRLRRPFAGLFLGLVAVNFAEAWVTPSVRAVDARDDGDWPLACPPGGGTILSTGAFQPTHVLDKGDPLNQVDASSANANTNLASPWTVGTNATTTNATWTGGSSTSTNWSDTANWANGQNPDGGGSSTVNFAGSTQTTSNNDYAAYTQFYSILFNSGASAFTLTGNVIKLYSSNPGSFPDGIENDSANLQTVSFNTGGNSLLFESSGQLNPTQGDLTITNGILLDANNPTLSVNGNNGHTLRINGPITVTTANGVAGSFAINDNDNVVLSGANTYSGQTIINAGVMNGNNNGAFGTSAVFVGSGTTANANTNASLFLNSGVTVSNNLTTNKADTGSGLGTGVRYLGTLDKTTGELDTFSGTLTLNGGATLVSSGSNLLSGAVSVFSDTIQDGTDTGNVSHALTVGGTGTYVYSHVRLSGNNTYSGGTTLTGSASLDINSATALGTGPFNINSTNDRIDNTSGAALTLTNNNAINLNGTLYYNGSTDSSHDLNFGTGAVTLNGTHFIYNAGAGTTITFGGAIGETTAGSGFYYNYTSNNQGTLVLTSTASTYTGNTVIYSGTVQVNSIGDSGSQGSLGKGSAIVFSGTSVNNALKYVGSGESTNRTIEVMAGSSNPPGIATIDASGSGALVLDGTFLPDTTSFSKTLILQGTNTGNNAVQFAITDPASGGGKFGVQKTGAGTWVLSGASTYTGLTTVNNGKLTVDSAGATTARLANTSGVVLNGGTLLLANSGSTASVDRINDAATVTLNGGTLNTGGLGEHGGAGSGPGVTPGLGALTLQSNSVIDLGNGASVLAFANSSANSANWSGTLKIYDWSGNGTIGNGTDELFFGTDKTGLTTSQLASIQFYSDAGITPVGAPGTNLIFADGEVVPLPEPATWLGALGCVAALGLALSRRQAARQK